MMHLESVQASYQAIEPNINELREKIDEIESNS